MTIDEAKSLLEEIQTAFAKKDLAEVIKHYHPDVTYIGPAFSQPLVGLKVLQRALEANFAEPQRIRILLGEVEVRQLSPDISLVHCLVDGWRIIYLSEEHFKGALSRVFVTGPSGRPLIIHEHFSLLK